MKQARPTTKAPASAARSRLLRDRGGAGGGHDALSAPGELSVSEKVSATKSTRRDGVPRSQRSSVEPCSAVWSLGAVGAGVFACHARMNAPAAAICPGVCATGRNLCACGGLGIETRFCAMRAGWGSGVGRGVVPEAKLGHQSDGVRAARDRTNEENLANVLEQTIPAQNPRNESH